MGELLLVELSSILRKKIVLVDQNCFLLWLSCIRLPALFCWPCTDYQWNGECNMFFSNECSEEASLY